MTDELFSFLDSLSRNNNREWFAAEKPRYEALRARWTAELQQMIDALAEYDPTLAHVEARTCLYRIYRDIRFSKDKSPFKTYFSALVSPRGRHTDRGAYYVHVGADECGLYGGVWNPPSPMLKKLRKAIVDNIEEFEQIISEPRLQKLFPGWYGSALKTVPKGYDRNHPQAALLRLTEYGRFHECGRSFFLDPSWPLRAAEIMSALTPLINFLNYSIDEEV